MSIKPSDAWGSLSGSFRGHLEEQSLSNEICVANWDPDLPQKLLLSAQKKMGKEFCSNEKLDGKEVLLSNLPGEPKRLIKGKSSLPLGRYQELWGSEILSYLQANKWSSYSFMDTGRKHETPRSEVKICYYT